LAINTWHPESVPSATGTAAAEQQNLSGVVDRSGRLRSMQWRVTAPDVFIVLALTVTAFVLRRRGLPHDGLWHDDAAPVLGAVKGSAHQLLTVGFDHPAFTLVLRSVWPFTGGDSARMAYLPLLAGTLSPPALYLVLRRIGFARSISTLLGAALVASETDIIYSGRVKTYVVDVIIVLGLAVLVPVLARYSWPWYAGATWFAGAIVVSSFSAFALIATSVAGIVLVLHSRADRTVRVFAVGAQLVTTLGLVTAMQRTYNPHVIAIYWEQKLDGFLDVDLNPFQFAAQVLKHLTRVATVFPGGSTWWAALSVFAASVGLLTIAWAGRHAVRARFLLLVALVALVGGVLNKIPFGPKTGPPAMGGRVTLWLVPVMAIGLAATLQLTQRLVASSSGLRIGFNVIAYALATVVVITALARDTSPYPFPGSKSATRFIESELGKHDAVFVVPGGRYSFALETKLKLTLRAQPERNVGFAPRPEDRRLIFFDSRYNQSVVVGQIRAGATGADRVFIHAVAHADPEQWLFTLELLRRRLGFKSERTIFFDSTRVVVWQR
jgi:hypothetical protein